jgi:hypothetical protein
MPDWVQASSAVLTLIVMLVGLFGLILPIFPGGVVIWLAALGYGLLNGFSTPGIIIMVLITLLMIASALADNLFMGAGALRKGASWWSILIALAAGLVLTLVAPPFGGLIGAPVALYISEYLRRRDWDQAFQITRGMLVGCGWAFVVRFLLGLLKIGLWAVWVWGFPS